MVDAYEFVMLTGPRPEIPPNDASLPLVRVNEPRKNESETGPFPLATIPPERHTPDTAATEYDSVMDPNSTYPPIPPAPALHDVVVEMMDPVVHDLLMDAFDLIAPTMPPTQSTPVTEPDDDELSTKKLPDSPMIPPADLALAPLLTTVPEKVDEKTPYDAEYAFRYPYPTIPPT